MNRSVTIIDCTLRDGGYYNSWDFEHQLINDYFVAMSSIKVDFVEVGFRSLKNEGFKGGCAFSSDNFLNSLSIPNYLKDKLGVMVNGSELSDPQTQINNLEKLFTSKKKSPISLVRIACSIQAFVDCLPAANWLKDKGYLVGFNLMQVTERELPLVENLSKQASQYPIDVLYFADSLGNLFPKNVIKIIETLKKHWSKSLGIHTHDNMGQAVANTLQAIESGVSWIDCTVSGMGRGAGNAQTEYLLILLKNRGELNNVFKLYSLIRKYFLPMKHKYGWGVNQYYYLAGKHNIHPTYIQKMLQDSRYNDEDIISVINYLKSSGGKKFSLNTLDIAKNFYSKIPKGVWCPSDILKEKELLIIGTGPSVIRYKLVIEEYIKDRNPYVIALNTESSISQNLIDARAACHPVRLLADYESYLNMPQPLITPLSMLPSEVKEKFLGKKVFDFGLVISSNTFSFDVNFCTLPNLLVMSYTLSIAASGQVSKISLVGFDGYEEGDEKNNEFQKVFDLFQLHAKDLKIVSLTPTKYHLKVTSIYGC